MRAAIDEPAWAATITEASAGLYSRNTAVASSDDSSPRRRTAEDVHALQGDDGADRGDREADRDEAATDQHVRDAHGLS
jgi:hypothetical protein